MSIVKIQLRRGTASQWNSVNPTLAVGEAGYETDTHQIKIGDGTSNWNDLEYATVTPQNLTDAINAAITGVVDVDFATITDVNNAISQEVLDRNSAINTAKSEVESFTTNAVNSETARAEAAEALLAPINNAQLTGNPTAPTPNVGDTTTSIATTAFVETAVANLVNSAPATLDTLKKLADAIGDDTNYAATIAAEIAGITTNGTLETPTLSSPTINAPTINYDATFTGNIIAPAGSINGSSILDGSVNGPKIANSSITTDKIVDGTILGSNISSNTILGSNIALETINGNNIASAAITSEKIFSKTIISGNIADEAIIESKIANLSVTEQKIVDKTITGDKIADSTITGVNIVPGTITSSNIDYVTISQVEDLSDQISLLAPLTSPTFTTSVVLPANTSIGEVTSTEIGYLDGTTSKIQDQFNTSSTNLLNHETSTTNVHGIDDTAALATKDYADNAVSVETQSRITAVSNEASTRATAVTNAINTSESYTDSAISTEVTNRNSAINSAKSDAILTSENYTDASVATEVTNRNDAISTSLSSAESYTDSAIATEVTNRNLAIGASLSTSESYTDSAKTAAELFATNADSALHTTITGEIATAKSEAISTSEGYTDDQITNLVNAAPSTLNTLKELADAIGDDPSFAVTIGNYIVSAKADAEAYTDSSIATEVTNRNSAISSAVADGKSQAISTSEAYTDSTISTEVSDRNTAIGTSLSTAESYTDTAQAQAISTSESYTDTSISTEVTNRNSAILTAKNAAIATSEGYTDTAISTEVTNRNSAIETSLATAEGYTDTAKSAAISTSEGYTDTAISTEVTNRNSAIETAKSQAISTSEGYVDSVIATEVSNSNSAIATAKSQAISTSEGYADSVIATEVSNRNTAISNATANMVQTTDTGSVTSTMILDGTIVDADINASAAIAYSKLNLASSITSADIVDGTIVDADISSSAAIADTKLATITSSGKIANSATTATDANTASTIVARDASGNFTANLITVNSVPTAAGHAASKAYVDNISAGMNWHAAVQAATSGVLPSSTYADGTTDANGGLGIGATLTATANASLAIDAVSVSNGNRVLIKNQADAKQNGIYVVTDKGSASTKWILTRATDSDNHIIDQVSAGDAVYVLYGSFNTNQSFVNTATGSGTNGVLLIGTDSITWTQFSGASSFVAGNGLVRTGNTVDVVSSTLNVTADSVDLATVSQSNTTGGNLANGIVSAITVDSYGRVTGYQTGAQNVASTSNKGIASFDSASFTVTSGNVAIKSAGVSNSQLANNSVTIGSTSVSLGGTASTLAGLTLTAPVIAQITNTGTLTLPTSTDTLVGRATTDTLTNKTLTSPVINTPTGITKSDVGLSNVDNTADSAKPVSIATQTTLDGKVSKAGGDIITSSLDSTISLRIKGTATQTADLQQWQNSAGTVLASVATSGYLTVTGIGVGPEGIQSNASVGINIANFTNSSQLAVSTGGASYLGIVVRGAASQTGDLQQWQDSTGTVLAKIMSNGSFFVNATGTSNDPITIQRASATRFKVDPYGNVFASALTAGNIVTSIAGTTVGIYTNTASSIGLIVRGTASQTADLQEWQDSNGTVLAKVDASGNITATSFVGGLTGNVSGNASTATALATPRNINGVAFDGSAAITITAANPNALTIGTGLSGTSYTGSGAVTIAIDSTVSTLTGTQTLTNKTLTSPTIGTILNTGTLTLPTSTDTLIGKATTDTLTNKTFDIAGTGNVFKIAGTQISTNTGTGAIVLATSPTITGLSTDTLNTTGNVVVGGNLTVNGTTTTINSTTLNTTEQVLVISNTATPTDVTANGAGITIKGTTDKTVKWYSSTGALTSSENIDLASGKTYKIAGTTVLSPTAVGGQTIPASAIVGLTDTQTLTNKSISGSTNTLTSIPNSALTNSTISGVSLGSNLNALTLGTGLTGTSYNGSGAVTAAIDTSVVTTLSGTQTLTNKTLTSPSLSNAVHTGTTTVSSSGITFSDGTVQTVAAVPSITTIATTISTSTTISTGLKDQMVPVGASVVVTLPQDSAAAYPIGASIDFYATGTGAAFAAGTGSTITVTPGLKFRAIGSVATAMKVAANTWLVFGDLTA